MKLSQVYYKNGKWSESLPKEMDSQNTLIFAFFKSEQSNDLVWKELKESFPQSQFMGCSGSGTVRQIELVDDEIVLTFTKFESTKIKKAIIDLTVEPDSEKAGEKLAKQLPLDQLKSVFVISDGLHVNGSALIKGIKNIIGEKITIAGGLAGDGTNFKHTFVLGDLAPVEKSVSAIGFYGDHIQMITSAGGGWRPFGPVRKITKSEANVVYEFDHKPALALYKEFLGEQAKKLPSAALMFPIHLISGPEHQDRYVVRTILAVDETNQSMTFAGDVPVGTDVELMRASQENLIGAAMETGKKNAEKIESTDNTLSLIVSCVGRRLVLGENTEGEIESIYEHLPEGTVQTGFYSYGELAPGSVGFCDLHNQTMTATLIRERDQER